LKGALVQALAVCHGCFEITGRKRDPSGSEPDGSLLFCSPFCPLTPALRLTTFGRVLGTGLYHAGQYRDAENYDADDRYLEYGYSGGDQSPYEYEYDEIKRE